MLSSERAFSSAASGDRLRPRRSQGRQNESQSAQLPLRLLLTLSGCKVGPNYQRPAVDVPGQYRGLAPPLRWRRRLWGDEVAVRLSG